MAIERRKAYIEFTSKNTCTITTPLKQKSFKLEKDDVIDLIELKKITSWNYPFYACAREDGCHDQGWALYVNAVIKDDGIPQPWGWVGIKDPSMKFEGNIWVDD